MRPNSPLTFLTLTLVLAAAALGVAVATLAQAADAQAMSGYSNVVDLTAGGMIGQPVYSQTGTKLGKVSDLVIGKADKVSYAVISVEAKDERQVVIPYQALKVGPKAIVVLADLGVDDADALPEYHPKEFISITTASRS
jgi:sporulation protein YlmC with PRC-barrel domain